MSIPRWRNRFCIEPMFKVLCGRKLNGVFLADPQIVIPQNAMRFIKLLSSKVSMPKGNDNKIPFTVFYLINSCGLSTEKAISASKIVQLKSPDRPDSVLAFFGNQGFNDASISKLVSRRPDILMAHPENTLLPKINFFLHIGVPTAVLVKTISAYPEILRYSLEKRLIPCYNYLKSFVHTDKRIAFIFKNAPKVFTNGLRWCMTSNVAILRNHEVPESHISFMVAFHPNSLLVHRDKFANFVNQVTEMGFESSKLKFVFAIKVLSEFRKANLEHKKKVYQRWGWSESDIRMAFFKHPFCMVISEKKIMSTMDFLVNKMGCESLSIARYPLVLFFNIERRIVPRCLVAKVLILKGLIKKTTRLTTFLLPSDEKFLKKFVTVYLEDIPKLLDLYEGKQDLADLGFQHEEISKVNLQ